MKKKTDADTYKEKETGFRKYLREQNIEFSVQRILIDGLGGMAQGLFASLLIGCIIGTISDYVNIPVTVNGETVNFLSQVKIFCYAVQGPAMAAAIACAMESPPYVLYSCLTVGYAANTLGGSGGPLAVFFVTAAAVFLGKLVSKRTPVDLLVTPAVTIIGGVAVAALIAPPIGQLSMLFGQLIMVATELQPFLMGIVCSVLMGMILTLPISSAAICSAFGLVGLAGGACVAGCCAHMVGFAAASYRENKIGGLVSQGLGTSMLQIPNLIRKPVLWLPPVLASAITGPIATCVFKLQMNGEPIASGMGSCGLVGPIGLVTGWLSPSEAAANAAPGMGVDISAAYANPAMNWLGLALVCFILPAALSLLFSELMRGKGWIKEGDYKLDTFSDKKKV